MRRSLSVLSQFSASMLLALTMTISSASADITAEELKNAFLAGNAGLAATAKAEADVVNAQTAYVAAVAAMSAPAVLTAKADIERLTISLEALAVAKENGANVTLVIKTAEDQLAVARAIFDATKPAYDAAAANLAGATATAAMVRASYDDAFALIATAIAEPNVEQMVQLDVANARIAHFSLNLQKVLAEQANTDLQQQEQLDDQGAAIEELQAQLDWESDTVASLVDKSDDVFRLQVGLETNNQNDAALAAQVGKLTAYVAADAARDEVLCKRLRKDLYGKLCAAKAAAAAGVIGTP